MTLTCQARSQSASGASGPPLVPTPALATYRSMPFRCAAASAMSAVTPSSLAASPGTASPPISVATASAAPASRSLTTTSAPASASLRAKVAPIPLPAPVTTVPVPVRSMSQSPTEGHTAVEHQGVAGDPGGVVGEQEGHGPGDVLEYAETTHRVLGGDLFLTALVQGGSKTGLDHGGGDPVDPDVGGQLHRKFLGDVFDHCLGGAVETDAGGGFETCDRGDVDDRSAVLGHPGLMSFLHPRDRRQSVDLEDLASGVQLQVDHASVDRVDAGVVDKQVKTTESLDGLGDGRILMFGVIGPAGDGDGVRGSSKSIDRLLKRLGVARGDAHTRPLLHEPLGDGQADAAARAGDDGGPAAEPGSHTISLNRLVGMPVRLYFHEHVRRKGTQDS